MLTTNEQWFCYTNHSLTMVFVVKLWLYKLQPIHQKTKQKETWLLHLYYNKIMVDYRKGNRASVSPLISVWRGPRQRWVWLTLPHVRFATTPYNQSWWNCRSELGYRVCLSSVISWDLTLGDQALLVTVKRRKGRKQTRENYQDSSHFLTRYCSDLHSKTATDEIRPREKVSCTFSSKHRPAHLSFPSPPLEDPWPHQLQRSTQSLNLNLLWEIIEKVCLNFKDSWGKINNNKKKILIIITSVDVYHYKL